MERLPDNLINWADVLRGVGELIVDEAKLAFHAVFDHIHHEPADSQSNHFK